MTTHEALLPATVLGRRAVVYVRQSTPQQVQSNLESQRRQYELVDVARRRGFTDVEIIDDDLGRSASGAVDRPGFDRLVAALCAEVRVFRKSVGTLCTTPVAIFFLAIDSKNFTHGGTSASERNTPQPLCKSIN
jgi:hypothetical protein